MLNENKIISSIKTSEVSKLIHFTFQTDLLFVIMCPYSYDDGYCYVDEKGYEVGRYPIGWDELKEKIINGSPVGRFVKYK